MSPLRRTFIKSSLVTGAEQTAKLQQGGWHGRGVKNAANGSQEETARPNWAAWGDLLLVAFLFQRGSPQLSLRSGAECGRRMAMEGSGEWDASILVHARVARHDRRFQHYQKLSRGHCLACFVGFSAALFNLLSANSRFMFYSANLPTAHHSPDFLFRAISTLPAFQSQIPRSDRSDLSACRSLQKQNSSPPSHIAIVRLTYSLAICGSTSL